jgi:predicted glycogen debranching enzyme
VKLKTDYPSLAALEWLETNGLGGYAAGTVAFSGTRGYHGLLAAAIRPPEERWMIVTSCEEWLVTSPPVYLSTHQYPGVVHPEGYKLLESFEPWPVPTWTYRTAAHRVERRVFMVQGQNTTVVRYRLLAGSPVRLAVRPFFVFRDHHGRRTESGKWFVAASRAEDAVHCAASDGAPAASVYFRHGSFREEPMWYRRFEYLQELARGLPHLEDAYAPFVVELELARDKDAELIFTGELLAPPSGALLEREELERREKLGASLPKDDEPGRRLAAAADAFLVTGTGGRHSVIAGYPWFTDWGRDTMIALPGLALVTGKVELAGLVLRDFAAHLKDGLLPNRFPDRGFEPEYNTVDASLWFAVAVHRLIEAGGDEALVDGALASALEHIVDAYARGTAFGIREDPDRLIAAGADGVALTWMDARVGDWVVTPRRGKAVEINALWYNARCILAALLERQGRGAEAREQKLRAEATRVSFLAAFAQGRTGSLCDVIADDGSKDWSVRPNQLLAASLPYPLLEKPHAQKMVDVVERDLLTPMGLRTLAPSGKGYVGHYRGDVRARDAAYHQGTVWPWLLGPFVDALLFARGDTIQTRARAREILEPIATHLDAACLGQVSEVADGDPPHAPGGCPAQAWSVAEVLRVWRLAAPRRSRASRASRTVSRPSGSRKSRS